jgi:WD40 repeat protein
VLWEVASGTKLLVLGGHSSAIFDAAFSHSGDYLVTASRDRTARIWKIPAPTTTSSHINLNTAFRTIAISADDRLLALAGIDGSVQLLDRISLRALANAKPLGEGAVTFLKFDGVGSRLLAGSENGALALLSIPTLQPTFSASPNLGEITGGGFDPSGNGFSILTTEGSKMGFDDKGLARKSTATSGDNAILVMTSSPDQDRILVGRLDGTASIVDARGELPLVGHRGAILSAGFDQDGQIVITGSEDGTARIWDATTGQVLQTLDGYGSPVIFVAVSADGNHFATTSLMPDRAVRIWRRGFPEPLATYSGHLDGVDVVGFLYNGTGLISGSSDGNVHAWPFADDRYTMLNIARTLVSRCFTEEQLTQYGLQKSAAAWCDEEFPVGGGK